MSDLRAFHRLPALRPPAAALIPFAVAIAAAAIVPLSVIHSGAAMARPNASASGAAQRVGGGADAAGGARTHRLQSPDAHATARVITSLVDALGGHSDVHEVDGGGTLRLELSVPQESSGYLLSKLEALGQITPAPPDPRADVGRYALSMELVGAR